MGYSFEFRELEQAVHIRYRGDLDFAARCRCVDECFRRYPGRGPYRLLIDVRDCNNRMNFEEQKAFALYLKQRPEMLGARVAILHRPVYNPNLVIDSFTTLNGSNNEPFTQEAEALAWLAAPGHTPLGATG